MRLSHFWTHVGECAHTCSPLWLEWQAGSRTQSHWVVSEMPGSHQDACAAEAGAGRACLYKKINQLINYYK